MSTTWNLLCRTCDSQPDIGGSDVRLVQVAEIWAARRAVVQIARDDCYLGVNLSLAGWMSTDWLAEHVDHDLVYRSEYGDIREPEAEAPDPAIAAARESGRREEREAARAEIRRLRDHGQDVIARAFAESSGLLDEATTTAWAAGAEAMRAEIIRRLLDSGARVLDDYQESLAEYQQAGFPGGMAKENLDNLHGAHSELKHQAHVLAALPIPPTPKGTP